MKIQIPNNKKKKEALPPPLKKIIKINRGLTPQFFKPTFSRPYLIADYRYSSSFINIIFSQTSHQGTTCGFHVSILYKYHISQKSNLKEVFFIGECRSFISIIFPWWTWSKYTKTSRKVSILYKYHISPGAALILVEGKDRCRSFISIIFPAQDAANNNMMF